MRLLLNKETFYFLPVGLAHCHVMMRVRYKRPGNENHELTQNYCGVVGAGWGAAVGSKGAGSLREGGEEREVKWVSQGFAIGNRQNYEQKAESSAPCPLPSNV